MRYFRRLAAFSLLFAVGAAAYGSHAVAVKSLGSRVISGTGVEPFVRLESSTPVYDVLYRYGQVSAASNGAYGANITAPRRAWFIEEQRAGSIDILDGVLRPNRDPAMVAEGMKIFRFGLDREAPNGTFPGSAWPFHGTAMFLAEAAPALLALRASGLDGQFAPEVQRDAVKMQRAAYAMVSSVGGPKHIDDTLKNHRLYEAALALGSVGMLAGDGTLQRWSRMYAWRGVHMERPNGVMPENGSHDSGYQALGMVDAIRYAALVATGSLKTAMLRALGRGEAWELSRVAPDGSVNQSGDTRTAGCKEHNPLGQCKAVMYAPIFSTLAHWAGLNDDARFAKFAHLVWLRSGYGGH